MNLIAKAYAKINLHLEALNRRYDGYHNILGLFASIDLYDLLTLNRAFIFENTNQASSIEIIPAGGIHEDLIRSIGIDENLITKSVNAYFEKINTSGDVSISIRKDVPAEAGLGGGSSDAAACLLLLNSCFQRMNKAELLNLGAKIGSDVPYCLTRGFAICEGTGNIIETIDGKLDCNILVVDTGIHISTADAYRSLDRGYNAPYNAQEIQYKRKMLREFIEKGEIVNFKSFFKNDFEEPVFKKFPDVKKIKDELYKMNADFVTMTGSGAAIIALFQDIEKARLAEKKIEKSVKNLFITRFSENSGL